jgi:hypothetical protein
MNDELQEEHFSDDPEEQLRIENEILKLQIQAELGGAFEGEETLPPEVENLFLKNVLELEHKQANAPTKTLLEILENPSFVDETQLNDDEVKTSLFEIENLMEDKGIVVDYGQEYTPRTKYKFITEELFQKEAPVIEIPGMTMHFIYEEFHPNHALDIEKVAEGFFNCWISRDFDDETSGLAEEMILDNGTIVSFNQLHEKLQLIFDAYENFENASFTIESISFELHEDEGGLGYCEGIVAYNAILESGEVQHVEGPYKLFMQYNDFWSIFFFEWPGFIW